MLKFSQLMTGFVLFTTCLVTQVKLDSWETSSFKVEQTTFAGVVATVIKVEKKFKKSTDLISFVPDFLYRPGETNFLELKVPYTVPVFEHQSFGFSARPPPTSLT